jgi:hypothetical protein
LKNILKCVIHCQIHELTELTNIARTLRNLVCFLKNFVQTLYFPHFRDINIYIYDHFDRSHGPQNFKEKGLR